MNNDKFWDVKLSYLCHCIYIHIFHYKYNVYLDASNFSTLILQFYLNKQTSISTVIICFLELILVFFVFSNWVSFQRVILINVNLLITVCINNIFSVFKIRLKFYDELEESSNIMKMYYLKLGVTFLRTINNRFFICNHNMCCIKPFLNPYILLFQ